MDKKDFLELIEKHKGKGKNINLKIINEIKCEEGKCPCYEWRCIRNGTCRDNLQMWYEQNKQGENDD